MVRVTNKVLANTLIQDIRRNQSELLRLQKQISTQKKVEHPADDPINADRSVGLRHAIEKTRQYDKNVGDAKTFSRTIDVNINEMEQILLRARDLAVRGANEAIWVQSNYNAIADEVDSILEELIADANEKFEGKFLYSGFKTTTAAFKASNKLTFLHNSASADTIAVSSDALTDNQTTGGSLTGVSVTRADGSVVTLNLSGGDVTIDAANDQVVLTLAGQTALGGGLAQDDTIELTFNKTVSVSYEGDQGVREIEVSEGVRVGLNFVGATTDLNRSSVFGDVSLDPSSDKTAQAFKALMNFRDGLRKHPLTNDIQPAQLAIDEINEARERLTTVRSQLGGRVNRYELAENRLSNIEINATERLADIEQIDLAEAITKFSLQQTVYQAALGAGAQIIQPTLLNFLR